MSEAIKYLLQTYANSIKSREDLEAAKRAVCKKYALTAILNSDILQEYRRFSVSSKLRQPLLETILRKRSIRTLSGIAPVAILTEPYPCPGQCAYCPHEKDVPTSYLSNEPAVMRAIRCDYDPYRQIISRLWSLEKNGHEPTKIEIIVIGGTWSYLPKTYKYWYILNCFRAANDYQSISKRLLRASSHGTLTDDFKYNFLHRNSPYRRKASQKFLQQKLKSEQKKNEKAGYRIVGLTLETRPDYINEQELLEMREFGCTRVEIGVQAVDDEILRINKRGHGVAEISIATKALKQYGFKITYHLMPALPGATPAKDFSLFKKLFTDDRFQPDQIKFYPTVVTKGSLLYRWYKQGRYKPYSNRVLENLISKCKGFVPPYVRIIRLIRDIPGESIVAGNKVTNLRQIMKDRGVKCLCIRCRESRNQELIANYKISILEYQSAGGREYFISADSADGQTLYGFCRLRIDFESPVSVALIRELHVYGELVSVGGLKKTQHSGLGKELLGRAEEIAIKHGAACVSVISGVGVRGYYRKLGYRLAGNYMVKKLNTEA